MSKILFTDFDETLLSRDKTVSQKNREAIAGLIDAGHYIAYTTGRALPGAMKLVEKLNLPKEQAYLLCFQGNLIYDLENKKQLHHSPIAKEDVKSLVSELEKDAVYLEVFGRDYFYVKEETEATRRYTGISQKENYKLVSDWSVIDQEPIYKVMAIDFEHPEVLEKLQQKHANDDSFPFDHFYSSPWFYEYCAKGKNKGQGLKDLSRILQIPIADTVAVGDEENDISMIQAAGVGAIMQNAREELKSAADYITENDNNHDGVAEVIERFIL